ncbi:alpha-beta hydrolase superfamily lysophospholipase [Herbihabitans rhizosphaerae]|uniref:Alpha-beta hydrolase superfamily lysophospholipase n=1 Tax=Herbihabitans rhizosphaerae TaxID=1872711 RepID=A0A4Q7KXB3_9PSEU|nr:alpha/beta fold hydrolase [Herbihabitans rhizosphaerae]RZS41364.1 alpha-beta hydrolase superfamily lysophospholipase [Herbihabitans rhizosphaerae]
MNEITVPVPGIDGATAWGRLCVPDHPRGVQVLVHGATYTHEYWSPYAERAHGAGWATLALDRPGHGRSTPLRSDQPSAPMLATLLAGLITDLRGEFARVALAGHSSGAAAVLYFAQHHPGVVDALVLTGMTHVLSRDEIAFPEHMHPAREEERFASLDGGWITTVPGTRGVFYPPGELPQWEEPAKSTVCAAETAENEAMWATPLTVPCPPVLMLAGSDDRLFHRARGTEAALLAFERDYFPAGTEIAVRLVPDAGHSLAESESATNALLEWLGA